MMSLQNVGKQGPVLGAAEVISTTYYSLGHRTGSTPVCLNHVSVTGTIMSRWTGEVQRCLQRHQVRKMGHSELSHLGRQGLLS